MGIQLIGYIILITGIALLLALFQYLYKSKKTKRNLFLAVLRFLSLFSILLLVLNPKLKTKEFELIKPKLIVAVDNSSSIKYAEKEQEILKIVNGFKNEQIASKFDVNYFSVGASLKRLDSLTFNENSTNLSQPIKELSELYSAYNNSVVLITDGKLNAGERLNFIKSKNTIFPVIIGDTTKYEDINISRVNVNKQSYLNNEFPVEVFINYEGEFNQKKWFRVYKNGSVVFQKLLNLSKRNNSEIISFYLKSDNEGQQFYTTQIEVLKNEKNTINNTKNFSVKVIKEISKIALISDILHPDLGVLKRAIESNEARKVTVLKPTELKNIKDYQLVILYQPVATFESIFKDIETQKINYFIITGTNTDWEFLNNIQTNFSKKAINQTENYYASFNPNYASFLTNELSFNNYPPLEDYFGEINFNTKYNSLLFQTVQGIETEKPLFATFENNNQKKAVLFGEHIWKWRMNSFQETKTFEIFDNFLAKTIQYLASKDLKNRLNVTVNDFIYSNNSVVFNASFLDEILNFDYRAKLWLNYSMTGDNSFKRVPFSLSGNSFTAKIENLNTGEYSYYVTVENQTERYSGKFKVLPFNIEQQNSSIDIESFNSVALNSNGTVFYENNVSEIVSLLTSSPNFKTIQKEHIVAKPIIDWKWLLFIILFLLSVEWFTRKYFGKI
jgi:hypothetical protein